LLLTEFIHQHDANKQDAWMIPVPSPPSLLDMENSS